MENNNIDIDIDNDRQSQDDDNDEKKMDSEDEVVVVVVVIASRRHEWRYTSPRGQRKKKKQVHEQDEWWYILESEFLFKVGDETFIAKKGDSVFGLRIVPHAFVKLNDGIAKMIIGFQPAGKMEEHFKSLSEGIYSKLTEEEKKIFRQKNGFEVVGPALTYDKT